MSYVQMMYAVAGLQDLLDVCDSFSYKNGIVFNSCHTSFIVKFCTILLIATLTPLTSLSPI